ncbi:MAG: hypothetical protein J4F35_12335 [Candidatus Latescibacteria bacterium]|nr:hypothetical protein [Candidatus Latescibacterota bacterium]
MGLVLPAHAQVEKSDLYIGLLLDFEAEATNAERDLALLQEEIHSRSISSPSICVFPLSTQTIYL